MFRNRKTSQKPDDDFISKFKKSFPDVITGGPMAGDAGQPGAMNPAAVDSAMQARPCSESDDIKGNDSTPRAVQDFKFTPSFMDPNSFQFMALANQPPGYYTPTPGGMATIFHPQAGDLHTPLGYNIVTPISIPNSLSMSLPGDPHGEMNMHGFRNPAPFMPHHLQNINPYSQAGFAPSTFLHSDSGYDTMDRSEDSPMGNMTMQGSQCLNMMSTDFSEHMEDSLMTDGEKFRYGVTLRAPTAMIRQADEIPVTYLNKGQAYSISVVDTAPPPPSTQPLTYRTFIRISFEDEQQRSRPAACWQLWKEGRGTNEAHQRGGKLLAVEYVDPIQGGDEDHRHPQVQLENASFDGFCVTWTPNPTTGSSDCTLSVRFNFLSTDFSHSKGVKGIPVRFCAKTELLSSKDGVPNAEVSFCKVKLFRDHGAERKLSNDVAHVKKTMEKLKQQIAQMELGGATFGKRKRSSGSISLKPTDNRSVKVPKHKRTWSMDSQENGGKLSAEDDLHVKFALMQDMFSSTRPVSVLSLRGDEQDDPDLHPVTLPGNMHDIKFESLSRQSTRESLADATSVASSILSPTTSSTSMNSPHRLPERQLSTSQFQLKEDMIDWSNVNVQHTFLNQPVKVPKLTEEGTTAAGYIEAIDIDSTYRPPTGRPPKPIACFYIRFQSEKSGDDYYRAVYLTERTVRDLMHKISEKNKIDPERIVRVLRINQNGLKVMVDDDVVRELPEGQDMVAEIAEASKVEVNTPDTATPSSAVEVQLTF